MALLVTGAMGHVGYEVVRQAGAGQSRHRAVRGTFREPMRAPSRAKSLGWGWIWRSSAVVRTRDGCSTPASIPRRCPTRAWRGRTARRGGDQHGRRRHTAGGCAHRGMEPLRRRQHRVGVPACHRRDANPGGQTAVRRQRLQHDEHCGELLVAMYRSQFDLSAATVRISWVYGPPLVPGAGTTRADRSRTS